MVGEPRTMLRESIDEIGFDLGNSLHVAAVPRVQHLALHPITNSIAVTLHLGPADKHFRRDRKRLFHDRCRSFLAAQLEGDPPSLDGQLSRDTLGELERLLRAVLDAQHRQRGAEAQIAHSMTSLSHDFVTLRLEGEPVDLHDVVEHASENRSDGAERLPVEARLIGEWVEHEPGEVD